MERLRRMISLLSMSMRIPPEALLSRQAPTELVSPRAVTNLGLPLTRARPFKWQRSSGTISEMKGGFQNGVKLWVGLGWERQQNLVLTRIKFWLESKARSWMLRSPVKNWARGR